MKNYDSVESLSLTNLSRKLSDLIAFTTINVLWNYSQKLVTRDSIFLYIAIVWDKSYVSGFSYSKSYILREIQINRNFKKQKLNKFLRTTLMQHFNRDRMFL